MKRLPQGRYTKEFREEAVKLAIERNMAIKATAEQLSLPPSTLAYWIEVHKKGKLDTVGNKQRPLTEIEMELFRTKKSLAEAKMEIEILKKAAAYFARESLPGTH
jgi:transposase